MKFYTKGGREDDEHYIFGSLFQRLIFHAPDPDGWPDPKNIIAINENRFFSQDIRNTWIAFNAKIAFRLGRMPHDKIPLSWVDQSGNLMVESVYWENGNMHLASKVSEAHAVEGWFVSISGKGIAVLKNSKHELVYEKRIERSYDEDRYKNKETINNITNLEF